jgi:phosphoribosylformylglycinamidine cyclo-ligase
LKYKDAGVDIEAARAAMDKVKALIRSTHTRGVVSEMGLFAGAFSASSTGIEDPLLLSSIDGVGTKLKIAFASRKFKSVGRDLVSHCCNDVLVHGAHPIFFLDYVAMDKLNPGVLEELIAGMAEECIAWDCALIGGETAEMPGFYNQDEFDLVGCVVGVVSRKDFFDGSKIRIGDRLIGLPSVGLHTNGFSLARRILFEEEKLSLDEVIPELGSALGEVLLAPHRSYLKPVELLLSNDWVTGMAHVTGGGLYDNISRVLPDGTEVTVNKGSWPKLPIFDLLIRLGQIEEREAFTAFNMGVGFVVFVRENDAEAALSELHAAGEEAFLIGTVSAGKRGVRIE